MIANSCIIGQFNYTVMHNFISKYNQSVMFKTVKRLVTGSYNLIDISTLMANREHGSIVQLIDVNKHFDTMRAPFMIHTINEKGPLKKYAYFWHTQLHKLANRYNLYNSDHLLLSDINVNNYQITRKCAIQPEVVQSYASIKTMGYHVPIDINNIDHYFKVSSIVLWHSELITSLEGVSLKSDDFTHKNIMKKIYYTGDLFNNFDRKK